jgi:hypothetical protein
MLDIRFIDEILPRLIQPLGMTLAVSLLGVAELRYELAP